MTAESTLVTSYEPRRADLFSPSNSPAATIAWRRLRGTSLVQPASLTNLQSYCILVITHSSRRVALGTITPALLPLTGAHDAKAFISNQSDTAWKRGEIS